MILASMTAVLCPTGPHADEELANRVRQFLRCLPLAVFQQLHVSVDEQTAVVEGVVRTFYERQLAIACIRRVAGVRRVVDLICVQEEAPVASPRRGLGSQVSI